MYSKTRFSATSLAMTACTSASPLACTWGLKSSSESPANPRAKPEEGARLERFGSERVDVTDGTGKDRGGSRGAPADEGTRCAARGAIAEAGVHAVDAVGRRAALTLSAATRRRGADMAWCAFESDDDASGK